MKRSEELRKQLEELKALKEKSYREQVAMRVDPTMKGWEAAWNEWYGKCGRQMSEDIRETERLLLVEINRELDVGDGATICLYSDRHACTVIAKTAKTITLRRDKAMLDPNFKLGRYTTGGDQSIGVSVGRHEFYDYNF